MSKLEGVNAVDVDLKMKIAVISMKPGNALAKDTVAAALKKSGRYGLVDFKEKLPVKKAKKLTAVVGVSGMT